MDTPRYWIGVVSQSHVARGVADSFAQLCHGKARPLERMRAGDWLIYYSPRTDRSDGAPCQAFTAIGRVRDDAVYQVELGADWAPFRRDIDYQDCQIAAIGPLLDRLSFIKDKQRWGYPFRNGHFAIGAADFAVIAAAMGVKPPEEAGTDA